MYLLGILIWIAVVVLLAWLATVRVKNSALRAILVTLAVPLSFILALADEIVGKVQFDRLCEEAKEVKIYATIPVGEELYTPEGKWRLGMATAEASRLGEIVESLVRWDHGGTPPYVISGAIVIYQFETRLYDRKADRLLAEWLVYSTPGGWLSSQFEMPLLVDPRCDPPATKGWGGVERVLSFKSSKGETK